MNELVSFLAQNFGSETLVDVSEYCYTPNTIEDNRSIFQIRLYELCDTIESFNSKNGSELSLLSRIRHNNNNFHIPMIDFKTCNRNELYRFIGDLSLTLEQHMSLDRKPEFLLFDSGRSFHAYGNFKLPNLEKFFAYAMLTMQGSDLLDNRWIAHRILSGYASLRLTKSSDYYLSIPRHIGPADSLGPKQ